MRDTLLRSLVAERIDRFIPPDLLRDSPEDARRARLAIGVGFLLVPVFAVLVLVHLANGNWREAGFNAFLGTVIGLIPFALRATGRFFLILNAILSITFVTLVVTALFARGAGITSATVALAEVPLFATLLGGVRVGAVWALLSVLAGATIGVLGGMHVISDRIPSENAPYDDHASLVVITATLFLVGVMYEFRKDESLKHIATLEEEKRRVELEKIQAVAESEVFRSERLASMGRLAASAAHEINNPLSYVANNLEFLRSAEVLSSEQRDAIREAEDGVARIRRIVGDLGTLSRQEEERVGAVDVVQTLRTALKMAENETRLRARVRTSFDPVAPVCANASRLVQVFLNLIMNAAQAIPEGHVDENEIAVSVKQHGSEWVCVQVKDTGHGIPPDIIERVKEPFFTTKPVGKGAGLGLSLCDGIVRRYGGRLEIESDGSGTSVRVVLQASVEAPADDGPSSGVRSNGPPSRPLRVLVVDDEPLVARAFARILKGHEVSIVGSGRDAVRRLEGGEPYDVVFCDMMMPDVTGMEVYEALMAVRPETANRIVFITGGTFTDRAREFRERVTNVFIQKPIDPVAVSRLIAERAGTTESKDAT